MRSLIAFLLLLSLFSCKSKMPVPNAALPKVVEETTVTPENVTKAKLYLGNDKSKDHAGVYSNNDSILSSHMKIEIIDKALFESQQSTAVNFWLEDTGGATKIDSLLTLKARDSIRIFTDNPADNEQHATYSYEGQLPVINQYVVLETLYEDHGYMLINKDTGITSAVFSDFPVISPDKKYIVSVHTNTYDPQSGDLNINRFENGKIVHLLDASFANWMPQESFYSNDGWLYLSVNHPKTYWAPDGEVNDEHQYIRIKLF